MSASQAGAIRTLFVITPRDHLPASAGQVTMATASTALQVSLLELHIFLTGKPNILLKQSVIVCQLDFIFSLCCQRFISGVCRRGGGGG